MLKLKRFLKNYKKEIILGPLFKLLEAVFELIVPLVMARIIDNGIANQDKQYVLMMSGVIIFLGVCGLAFALTCQYYAARCGHGFGTELRDSLYQHINSLSHEEIDSVGTSTLITRLVNDTNQAQTGVNMFIRLAVRVPFLIIGASVMAMALDLKLSVVFLIAAPVISTVLYLIMHKSVPLYRLIQKKIDAISKITRENLEGIRVIRAFAGQDNEKNKFRMASDDAADNAVEVGRITALLNPVTFAVMNLAIVGILWFGGVRVDEGDLSQGQITAFVNYMTQILLALVMLANLVVIFTKSEASANRINEIFEMESSIQNGEKKAERVEKMPAIEFKNVSFAYGGDAEPAVSGISFTLRQGETLGIIGGTGSGKSTVANLAARFYDATSGQILIYGTDIREYSLESLRKIIGTVPQKAALFAGTIASNIRWADENASDDAVVKALKTAQAWEFVSKMPDGINSAVAQEGRNFSGGQKQRLSVARAVAGNPPVLILDDSMSALDYATDLSLRKAIKEDLRDTAIIIIAQRTISIKNADKIMVLEDGEIAGMGTHEQLLETCEVYREICNTQEDK